MIKIIAKMFAVSLRNLFSKMLYLAVIALFCTLVELYCKNCFKTVMQAVINYSLMLCCIRWIMIITIAIFWPYVVRKVCIYYQVSDVIVNCWQEKRLYMVAWLIIFELLVCENSIIKIIQLI